MSNLVKSTEELDFESKFESVPVKSRQLQTTKNVNKRQLISCDRKRRFRTKVSKMIFNANLSLRGSVAIKNLALQSRCISTSIARKLNEVETGRDKEDLVVDYLDGDRSGIVVFGLNRSGLPSKFLLHYLSLRFFYCHHALQNKNSFLK